jgi:TetR/AcrR family transcriptional regulator
MTDNPVSPPKRPEGDGRHRILHVARQRFAEAGYGATSTTEIAKLAGVTHPLVHHHFGSKEGLWRAVVDELFADLPQIVADTDYRHDVIGWLEQTMGRLVAYAATHREIAGLITREGTTVGEHASYLMDRHLRPIFQMAIDALAFGQREGVVVADSKPAVLLFVALGAGVHVFNVSAHAREFDVDVDDPAVRAEIAAVFRRLMFTGLIVSRSTP